MRISVTGGAGFAGAHLVAALLSAGHAVQVYDNLFTQRRSEELPWLNDVRFVRADIGDAARLRQELASFCPEIVFHLAALHYIPYCDQHPQETMRVNVEGTLNLMLAVEKLASVKAVLYASSVAVYPPTDDYHSEHGRTGPCDIYGLSKLLGEQVVAQFAQQADINHLSLRLANIYGPGETNPHVIPAVLDQLLAGAETLQLGRTDPCRDFLYTEDLVEGLLRAIPVALRSGMHEVINLGPGQEWKVADAVEILCQLSGQAVRVLRDEARMRPVERMHLRANIAHARQLLAWEPMHDLRAGLEKTFAVERNRRQRRIAAHA